MKTFNISYTSDTDVVTLKSSLSSLGAILYTLDNIRVIGVSVSDDTDMSSVQNLPNVVVELDEGVTVEPHAEWYQCRVVSLSLPMKSEYMPLNTGKDEITSSVYLVDSGINTAHPEFSGSVIQNVYSYNESFDDEHGHGTAMASLINGQTRGMSKNAIVKNVKIPFGVMTIGQLLTAFDAILADHATEATVKVVNCSWTISKSQLLDSKILELQQVGLVVVAAAGNSGISADTLSPVGLNTVIGVAASDAYDRVISWASGASSNWGPDVDITAPGINVSVAKMSGDYEVVSGTSNAAAITSGVVAQYIASHSSMTAQQIQTLVLDTAIEDKLFRNESIYGTTPNKLLRTLFLDKRNIFNETPNSMYPVKKGETTILEFTTASKHVVSAEWADCKPFFPGGGEHTDLFFQAASWVTGEYSNGVFTLSVTPPEDIETGKYSIYITTTADDGNNFYIKYTLGVYESSSSELDAVEVEKYQTVDENDESIVRVSPAFCFSDASCDKGHCCNGACGAPYAC
jgi:subtilisin family serine protease